MSYKCAMSTDDVVHAQVKATETRQLNKGAQQRMDSAWDERTQTHQYTYLRRWWNQDNSNLAIYVRGKK